MKVAFRVDAGTFIGGGHLSRCITLAKALKIRGISQCYFILKAHQGNFATSIINLGYEVKVLPLEFVPNYTSGNYHDWVGGNIKNDAALTLDYLKQNNFTDNDWLVVDHYGLDIHFEKIIAKHTINVGVIDDLANRNHHCKFLVDQTCGRQAVEYNQLVSNDTRIMAGQYFSILRPEFTTLRKEAEKHRDNFNKIKKIFVNFGSTDPTNMTSQFIDTMNKSSRFNNVEIIVAVGSNTPHLKKIQNSAANFSGNINLYIDAANMSELMIQADVAIGAAGATTWERCALGLPTVIIKTAENQHTVITRIINFGVVVLHDINKADQLDELTKHLTYIENNYADMSNKCFNLIKTDGVISIVDYMLKDD